MLSGDHCIFLQLLKTIIIIKITKGCGTDRMVLSCNVVENILWLGQEAEQHDTE